MYSENTKHMYFIMIQFLAPAFCILFWHIYSRSILYFATKCTLMYLCPSPIWHMGLVTSLKCVLTPYLLLRVLSPLLFPQTKLLNLQSPIATSAISHIWVILCYKTTFPKYLCWEKRGLFKQKKGCMSLILHFLLTDFIDKSLGGHFDMQTHNI